MSILRDKIVLLLLGFLTSLVLLEFLLRIGGLVISIPQKQVDGTNSRNVNSHTILVLGESTSWAGGDYSWPRQFERILNDKGNGREFTVINKAVPGTNTTAILGNTEGYIEQYNPDIIVAMMGVNDSEISAGFIPTDEKPQDVSLVSYIKKLRLYKLGRLIWNSGSSWTKILFRKNPQDYDALIRLARYYRRSGIKELTEDTLQKAMLLDPTREEPYLELGIYSANRKRYQLAREAFNKAQELNPDNEWAYIELGFLTLYEDDLAKATDLMNKASVVNPANPWPLVGLGIIAKQQKKYTESQNFFNQALQLDPNNAVALTEEGTISENNFWGLLSMASTYQNKRMWQQAENALTMAHEFSPKSAWPLLELGRLAAKQGLDTKAEEWYRKAHDADYKNDWSSIEVALLYLQKNQLDKAEQYLKEAYTTFPGNEQTQAALSQLGIGRLPSTETLENAYIRRKQYDMIRDNLSFVSYVTYPKIIPKTITLPSAPQGEEATLRKSIVNEPDNDRHYLTLVQFLHTLNQTDQIYQILNQALLRFPSAEWVYVELQLFYRDQGQYKQAKEILQQAVDRFPEKDWPMVEMAKIYEIEQDVAASEKILLTAVEKYPNSIRALLTLSSIYRRQGKQTQSAVLEKKAYQLQPATKINYQKLASIASSRNIRLLAVQYPLRGIDQLKELLDHNPDVTYVDNEGNFQQALQNSSYQDYFTDRFAGDFGHTTEKGSFLIAKNAADALTKK